jgi:hypothetical protein
MQTAEKRTEPTLVRKKMTATLMEDAPSSFSRSLMARPPMTSGASPRMTNRYAQEAAMPAAWCQRSGAFKSRFERRACRAARTAEHEERGRVSQHAHRQHGDDPDEVVHLEIVDVLAQARGRLSRKMRARAALSGGGAGERRLRARTSAKLSGLAYAVLSSSSAHGRRCRRRARREP